LYGPLELDPHDDREEIDFDAADVLSSTQLCDVVNDRGNEDDEVEGDVPEKLKSVEGENVEKVSEDPNSINEEMVMEPSSSTSPGVGSRKRNATREGDRATSILSGKRERLGLQNTIESFLYRRD
jgi:hypothetical protein